MVEAICQEITRLGGSCQYTYHPDYKSDQAFELADDIECLIAIGGDGSLIRAADAVKYRDVLICGVNCGHMGYLCELTPTTVIPAISRLMSEDYTVEERMMITGLVNEQSIKNSALNDIVIRNAALGNVIRLAISVNGQKLFSYDCDGMILSTPTGSTAYNLSANGPVVNPENKLILLTPINAHTFNARTIVLSADDVVSIKLVRRNSYEEEVADVRFDGGSAITLGYGDELEVKKSSRVTRMIRLSSENFYEKMCNKMRED